MLLQALHDLILLTCVRHEVLKYDTAVNQSLNIELLFEY